jgi:alcohol dehydrogenase
MDALTHAAEAYIGYHDIPFVKKMSEEATRLIFENLAKVFQDGSLIAERENMLRASFCGAQPLRAGNGGGAWNQSGF